MAKNKQTQESHEPEALVINGVVESACICVEMRKKKIDSWYCRACKTDWV